MSDSENFRSLLGMTAFGAIIAYGGWSRIKRINRVKDSAKQIISAASAGQVEIEAIAWPVSKLEKCLENKRCVYLEYVLEHYTGGKNKSWKEIWRYNSTGTFLAFDQSGFLRISASKNHFFDIFREKIYHPHRMTTGQQLTFKSYCRGISVFGNSTFLGFSIGNEYRIKERKILLGSPVLIHGNFIPLDRFKYLELDEGLSSYREKCIRLLKSENFRKKFFDKDRDGSISREELASGFEKVMEMNSEAIELNLPISDTGEANCRYYGVVSDNENGELQIADTFEEQYLKSRSSFMAWLSFSSGLFVFFLGLYLIGNYLKHGR